MMAKIFTYLIGLVILIFFSVESLYNANWYVFNVKMASTKTNDDFLLLVRVLATYAFGVFYMIFKVQKIKTDISNGQNIIFTAGLIVMLLLIDIVQLFFHTRMFLSNDIKISSIFPLWLSFPILILYVSILLKFAFKKVGIKWL